jgi:hypothetical protein
VVNLLGDAGYRSEVAVGWPGLTLKAATPSEGYCVRWSDFRERPVESMAAFIVEGNEGYLA